LTFASFSSKRKISFIIIVVALEVLPPCKKQGVPKMGFFVNKISSPRNYTKWEWAYFCGIRVLIGDCVKLMCFFLKTKTVIFYHQGELVINQPPNRFKIG